MGVGHKPRSHAVRRHQLASTYGDIDIMLTTPKPSGRVASFDSPFERMRTSYEKERSETVSHAQSRDKMYFVTDPQASSSSSQQVTGRDRMRKLNESLNGFGLTRSKNQRWFHRQMTMSIIHKLFVDDLAENLDSLREEFEVEQFKAEVMIITPRRWGKTYAVGMFVAACASSIENTQQCIFSTGRRASKMILDLVYRFICRLPGMKESIMVKNVETVWIRGPHGPDDIRKISSYPSKVSEFCFFILNLDTHTHNVFFCLLMSFIAQAQLYLFVLFYFSVYTMDNSSIENTVRELMYDRRCVRCNNRYQELLNLGTHNCRVHVGYVQGTYDRGIEGTFTCCGISPNPSHKKYAGQQAARGCIACDHTHVRRPSADMCIPLERAKIIIGVARLNAPGIHVDEVQNIVNVHRSAVT